MKKYSFIAALMEKNNHATIVNNPFTKQPYLQNKYLRRQPTASSILRKKKIKY